MNESEDVQNPKPEPDVSPEDLSCPVCERLIPSPAPEACPYCQAPIRVILALLDTADLSLAEAVRDLKSGDLKSASGRLEFVKTTSRSHRLHIEIIRAVIDRLSGHPGTALKKLNAVAEKFTGEPPGKNLVTLLEAVRYQCVRDQNALAACCEHYNFALFEARRGHYEESRRSLIEALNEVPWHSDSHALMGKVLLGLREPDDARYHLRRALASDPTNATATRLLNELTRSEKITPGKVAAAVSEWVNKSPAWTGSIIVLVILFVIAITAILSK